MRSQGCGAFTGETSVEQMASFGAPCRRPPPLLPAPRAVPRAGIKWVLIGHSERRTLFAETDELIATKMKYALDKGFNVVYAIGEQLAEREKGMDATMAVCIEQLRRVAEMLDPTRVVIAYEPVWAIGTGVVATPEQAQETHKAIREWIARTVSPEVAAAIRIQYGGSANAKNAPDLSARPDIDGFLVGGASLKPEFADIVKAISAA